MFKYFLLTVVFCLTLISGFAQSINTTASKVEFEIGNMGFRTVDGTFSGMQGTIELNLSDLTLCNFDVCVDAASVNTENKKRDNHLRNEDFFDVNQYPQICFKSSEIIKVAEGYQASGELSMHGVTKPVQIPFAYENNTLSGVLVLNRFDYKVGEETGKFMVGEEVDIKIICVLEN